MLRRLTAIEIAEGALLADIAVIFHIVVMFLPVGSGIFRLLSFVVFAVLGLRRGVYVGVMAMCVAFFISAVVTGPLSVISMSIQVMGGLFLGVVMKYRMRDSLIIVLGMTLGALAGYVIFALISLVFGINLVALVQSIYDVIIGVINGLAPSIGLGGWWQHSLYPPVASVMHWILAYWWVTFYIALWIGLCPVVIFIYALTNFIVRLLGYDVCPFPGGKINRLRLRIAKKTMKMSIKRRIIRRHVSNS